MSEVSEVCVRGECVRVSVSVKCVCECECEVQIPGVRGSVSLRVGGCRPGVCGADSSG